MSEWKVVLINVGIPELVDGYVCDFDELRPCLCPYDRNFTQTFVTYEDYKFHMQVVHECDPFQKRKVRKPCSSYVTKARSERTRTNHQQGIYRNTHVKKDTLKRFVQMYDDFIQDLFLRIQFQDRSFERKWDRHFRITDEDLDHLTLEEILDHISHYYESRWNRREVILGGLRPQHVYDEEYDEYL